MKHIKKLALIALPLFCLSILSGCALGAASAATAGYSIKAQTADGLTAEAEERIVERTKREVLAEMTKSNIRY